ncbi:MAG: 2-hydroxyacyl-CoA dehydratase [Bacteroidetes bacterium]|jgi:benzoyl-CoA reductase/2-hydroxyglutaryl-CoA dehydratase subunit BcrC/BadD/HgdB|nr:2-hydroxyacyl-CoA dehydratase [Bacteroidota bacterium]MBT6685079.1 2-hydroxyacyl-CoA dehydratase [Bacteroidota bacterium]MBT7142617.1 2-hydroxyacyl-CoA dehydratase [Bacteroidota bacterium]MBT7493542.1 2-hydroxyacyl-CoA dehydratase [Bacteroidota bacterium]
MKKIGITTTVPIEVLYAAGFTPVDMNNLFIESKNYSKFIDIAERDGFPKSMCAWIKGMYGACIENNISVIVGVIEGDCSNTKILSEILQRRGIKVYPFSFPFGRGIEEIEASIRKLISDLNAEYSEVEKLRNRFNKIRNLGIKLDELTYLENKANGWDNHFYLVNFSDFCGNPDNFETELTERLAEIEHSKANHYLVKLGYIGVPPMTSDIYKFANKYDATFVYNEVQREFAFPRYKSDRNIFEQYQNYTYPYNNEFRISEIKKQIKLRKIDAIIHYTQAFCHRAIENIILKEEIEIPIINIEGDKLNVLDARTKLRLEAFLDMVADIKKTEL